MDKFMGREDMCGLQGSSTKANGRKDSRTATAYGKVPPTILILENGEITSHMAMENMSGVVEIGTKVSGRHV